MVGGQRGWPRQKYAVQDINAGIPERVWKVMHEHETPRFTAQSILDEFDAYYAESREIPWLARRAFENRDPGESLLLSRRRLLIYSESIREVADSLKRTLPGLVGDEALWREIEAAYLPLIGDRYQADLATAYFHSVRRILYQDEWKPVEYSFGGAVRSGAPDGIVIHHYFPGGAMVTPEMVVRILGIPNFETPFQDIVGDATLAAGRVNRDLGFDGRNPRAIRSIQFIACGFYRNRGAYLVGRIITDENAFTPFVLSLDNYAGGIFVDAVLTSQADVHNIFSSTLANFHVTDPHYHELSAFLHSIMPHRPLGLHYSTIGFNHVGKVAAMNELRGTLMSTGETFDTAVGFRGTVAIGFSTPSLAYVLKIIRDKPTEHYKWGAFEGIASVLHKYARVHEINRTGSMLDNIIFYNIRLNKDWFADGLRDELLTWASDTITEQGDFLIFKHLILQLKVIPLPVFLETASAQDAETAIVNLGHCIRNNAAANIFNKDLDGRNYGVSPFLKVFLFDYDAVEPLTDIKIRTNLDRIDGEEDVPDWVFEDGVIFLPEEIESGLRIPDRALRRLFQVTHRDLLTTEYWQGVQRALSRGRVPRIRVYPESTRLHARDVDRSRA